MTKKEFNDWAFHKGQSVYYKEVFYNLEGVNFELNRVCIKIDDKYDWISHKNIQLIPF